MNKRWKYWMKSASCTVLSYIILTVVAAALSVIRGSMNADSNTGITWWIVLEFLLVPFLFFGAGYFVTAKFSLERIKGYKVFLFGVLFSGALFALWYGALGLYVLFNVPAAEGSYMLDLWLRKVMIVRDYVYLYLEETDGYRYVILPFVHGIFRIFYWLLYFAGNRCYIAKKGNKRK